VVGSDGGKVNELPAVCDFGGKLFGIEDMVVGMVPLDLDSTTSGFQLEGSLRFDGVRGIQRNLVVDGDKAGGMIHKDGASAVPGPLVFSPLSVRKSTTDARLIVVHTDGGTGKKVCRDGIGLGRVGFGQFGLGVAFGCFGNHTGVAFGERLDSGSLGMAGYEAAARVFGFTGIADTKIRGDNVFGIEGLKVIHAKVPVATVVEKEMLFSGGEVHIARVEDGVGRKVACGAEGPTVMGGNGMGTAAAGGSRVTGMHDRKMAAGVDVAKETGSGVREIHPEGGGVAAILEAEVRVNTVIATVLLWGEKAHWSSWHVEGWNSDGVRGAITEQDFPGDHAKGFHGGKATDRLHLTIVPKNRWGFEIPQVRSKCVRGPSVDDYREGGVDIKAEGAR
jgi:hypothetical protein